MPAPLPLTTLTVRETASDGGVAPEDLFLSLFADEQAAFWLDAGSEASAGWSILGAGEAETDPAKVRAVVLADAAGRTGAALVDEDASIPFGGGWVGWLPYEAGADACGAPVTATDHVPSWIAVDRAIAVDHEAGRIVALAPPERIEAWAAAVRDALAAGIRSKTPGALEVTTARPRHGVEEYIDLVEECRAAIERGDAYQLCLTTRFTVARPAEPLAVYRRLRAATPAHHGGYLRIGERHLLSASPEQFVTAHDGVVSTSPIKGTRPRGTTPQEDARLAAELRADAKERAENVMIVDLMRNDLSHVGVPGSVRVERLWEVETYPAVHQLVSTVSARLRDGVTFGELCDAAFPAGSMTGAPKLSAMTILHRLEQGARGVYSGCFGHVGIDGRVDLAMVIRSVVVSGEEAVVGAGGGITWLSKAPAEAAEVSTKARAPLAALGAELPDEWAALIG